MRRFLFRVLKLCREIKRDGNEPDQVVQIVQHKGIHRSLLEMVVLPQAETAGLRQVGMVGLFPVEMVARYLHLAVVALPSGPENTKKVRRNNAKRYGKKLCLVL